MLLTARRTFVDGDGLVDATLLPDLIDAHVHLAFDGSRDPVARLAADDDHTLLLRMRAHALASGPPITSPRGHCWFLGGEAEGPDGIRAAVRERAARGVDVIKVMAGGGNLTPTVGPHESQFGRAELAAAVEEAHACGLPLAVHAHGTQAVLDALDVGADSIEHCTLFTADGVDTDPEVLARIVAGSSASVISATAGAAPPKPHGVLPHGVTGFLTDLGLSPADAIIHDVVAVFTRGWRLPR